jgi:WD40 repeat protein
MSGPALRIALVVPLTLWAVLGGLAAPPEGDKSARLDAHGDPLPEGAVARLGTVRFRPAGYQGNSAVALSPDGKVVAIGGPPNNQLAFLDTATGKEVRRIESPSDRPNFLAYSPDGKYLATVQMRGGLQLYDAATGAPAGQFPGDGGAPPAVFSTAFSADGKVVALGVGDRPGPKLVAAAWDVATRKKLCSFDVLSDGAGPGGFQASDVQVALSTDGKVLASWGRRDERGPGPNPNLDFNRTIQLWDVAAGKAVRQIKTESFPPRKVTFAPDGKQLAVLEPNAGLTVYEAETGKTLRRFAVRSEAALRIDAALVRYSPDGKLLLVGGGDGAVQVWETATGKRVASEDGPDCKLHSVAFQGDGKVLACGGKGQSLCLWEVTTGAARSPRGGHTGPVNAVHFGADGKTVLSAGPDGLRVWDAATGGELRQELPAAKGEERFGGLGRLLFSADGKYLGVIGRPGRRLRVLDFATGKEFLSVDMPEPPFGANPNVFGGDRVASHGAIWDGMRMEAVVRVWDLTTGAEVRTLRDAQDGSSDSLTLSRDGKYVAVASMNRAPAGITLWRVDDGKEVLKLKTVREQVRDLTFSPDGSLLAAVCDAFREGATVRFWDTRTGAEVPLLREQGAGYLLTFSPDGRTLAQVVARGQIPNDPKPVVQLLELATGKIRAEFGGHQGRILALAFSPDGRTLATGGADTTVLLWDATGRVALAARDKLTAEELDGLWAELGSDDARKAFRALARLTATPADAVALVKKELPPAREMVLEAKEVEALIAALDSDEFETRQKASQSLAQAGKQVRPALVKALEANPSLEKRRQLQKLLDALDSKGTPSEMVRPTRALELLERLGTPEARRVVEELARGQPGARLTEDALAMLKRMDPKP